MQQMQQEKTEMQKCIALLNANEETKQKLDQLCTAHKLHTKEQFLVFLDIYRTMYNSVINDIAATVHLVTLAKHQSPPTANTQHFIAFCKQAKYNPKPEVLRKIVKYFGNALANIFDSESAIELYEMVKRYPETSTKMEVMSMIQVSLNGPLDDRFPKLIIGADSNGCPCVAKIDIDDNEMKAVETIMQLDNLAISNIVPCRLVKIKLENDKEAKYPSGIFRCIIMPKYPITLMDLPIICELNVIHKGCKDIMQALQAIHNIDRSCAYGC